MFRRFNSRAVRMSAPVIDKNIGSSWGSQESGIALAYVEEYHAELRRCCPGLALVTGSKEFGN